MTTLLDNFVESPLAVATSATVSAGNNRLFIIMISLVDAASAKGYDTFSFGDQAMTLLVEEEGTGSTHDVATQVWYLTEAQLTAKVGDTLAGSGGSGNQAKSSIHFSVQDATQTPAAGVSFAGYNNGGSVSLDRVENSMTFSCSTHDWQGTHTLTNPVKTNSFIIGTSGSVAYGAQADSFGTSDASYTSSATRDSSFVAFNIAPDIAPPASIVDIDGDNTVYLGQATNISMSGSADTAVSVTLGGKAQTIEAGATATNLPVTISNNLPYGTHQLVVEVV